MTHGSELSTANVLQEAFRKISEAREQSAGQSAGTTLTSKRKRPSPLSVRLSPEERKQLEHDAAGMPLGAYVKERLFSDGGATQKRKRRHPIKNQETLVKVLARLGQDETCTALRQLAVATSNGRSSLSRAQRDAIEKACDDISLMRAEIIKALGLGQVSAGEHNTDHRGAGS